MKPRWAIVLLIVPVVLWVLHVAWVLPEVERRVGCDAMIFGGRFVFISGGIMIVCEIAGIIAFAVTRRRGTRGKEVVAVLEAAHRE